MKRVRYIGSFNYTDHIGLTPGKIYNVISYIIGSEEYLYLDRVMILNDNGVMDDFFTHSYTGEIEFEDITALMRNEVIGDILA